MFVGKNFLDAKKRHISKADAITIKGDGYFNNYFTCMLLGLKHNMGL